MSQTVDKRLILLVLISLAGVLVILYSTRWGVGMGHGVFGGGYRDCKRLRNDEMSEACIILALIERETGCLPSIASCDADGRFA